MNSIHRLKDNRDFQKVFQKGKSFANRYLVLYHAPNQLDHYRVGFSVSKKVGNAVVRNRVKRYLREAVRAEGPDPSLPVDFVIIARPSSAGLDFDGFRKNLVHLLMKTGYIKKESRVNK
ncbi:ribonuclease P protein component [Effusibacillus lacus]|uniref:Ribonuclease P protein component n=1 Tax=Effusibacillus lacus TaxID=1348429 RepID=A0A292YJQ7_9BACL|nr:ribonuclease P protein component [Effusibacillus lacus]TCS75197.1 ribonuclease P protein component [Effusibacillus lacus]GAX89141.1 ribonuclease P protein component [Effusibacillus lacus]